MLCISGEQEQNAKTLLKVTLSVRRGPVLKEGSNPIGLTERWLKKALDLAPWGRVYAPSMGRDGRLIGEVASRSGVSRKALRLYERTGILPASRRMTAGYRVYGPETLSTLNFIAQARRLGFHLDEIKEFIQIRRSGRCPYPHVLDLIRQKAEELDRTLADLAEVRRGLQGVLKSSSRSSRRGEATVCHHIERLKIVKGRR